MTSYWWLWKRHGWSIYTTEIGKCYQSGLSLLLGWRSRLEKVMEKLPIMQLKLTSLSWLEPYIVNSNPQPTEETSLQYLKISNQLSKESARIMDKQVGFQHDPYCFAFILTGNVNENRTAFPESVVKLCSLPPMGWTEPAVFLSIVALAPVLWNSTRVCVFLAPLESRDSVFFFSSVLGIGTP